MTRSADRGRLVRGHGAVERQRPARLRRPGERRRAAAPRGRVRRRRRRPAAAAREYLTAFGPELGIDAGASSANLAARAGAGAGRRRVEYRLDEAKTQFDTTTYALPADVLRAAGLGRRRRRAREERAAARAWRAVDAAPRDRVPSGRPTRRRAASREPDVRTGRGAVPARRRRRGAAVATLAARRLPLRRGRAARRPRRARPSAAGKRAGGARRRLDRGRAPLRRRRDRVHGRDPGRSPTSPGGRSSRSRRARCSTCARSSTRSAASSSCATRSRPPASPPTGRPPSNATLNPHRNAVTLRGPRAPAPGANQALQGSFVTIVDFEPPVAPPPTEPAGADFDFDVRTNDFAAVNAYHHCDRFFRVVERPRLPDPLLLRRHDVPGAGRPPRPLRHARRHRAERSCIGTGTGGIANVDFELADLDDIAHPIGIANDGRVVLHELGGHGILYDHVNFPNFGFAHSAGDSFGAILSDPETLAPDRFETFPWVTVVDRAPRPQRDHGLGLGRRATTTAATAPSRSSARRTSASTARSAATRRISRADVRVAARRST